MNTGQRLKNPHRCKVSLQNVGTKDSTLPYFFPSLLFPSGFRSQGILKKPPFSSGKRQIHLPGIRSFREQVIPGSPLFRTRTGKRIERVPPIKADGPKDPFPVRDDPGPGALCSDSPPAPAGFPRPPGRAPLPGPSGKNGGQFHRNGQRPETDAFSGSKPHGSTPGCGSATMGPSPEGTGEMEPAPDFRAMTGRTIGVSPPSAAGQAGFLFLLSNAPWRKTLLSS